MAPRLTSSSGPLSPTVKENKSPRLGLSSGFNRSSSLRRVVVKPLGEHKADNCSPQQEQKTPKDEPKESHEEEKPPKADDNGVSRGKHSSLARDILSRRIGSDNIHGPCSLGTTLKVDVPRHGVLELTSRDSSSGGSSLKRSSQSKTTRHGVKKVGPGYSKSKGEIEGLSACKKHISFPTPLVKDSPKKQKLSSVKSFKGSADSLNERFAVQSSTLPVLVNKGKVLVDGKIPSAPHKSTSPEFVKWSVKPSSSTIVKTSQVDLYKQLATFKEPVTTPAFKSHVGMDVATGVLFGKDLETSDENDKVMMMLPQPSKSPEVKRRGGLPVASGSLSGDAANKDDVRTEDTPPPLPTNSPEFVKRGLVLAAGGCFGAGPIAGPEGVGLVRDRRKCKPRGILTIDGDSLGSSGSSGSSSELQSFQMMSVPAMASVEWMVGDEHGSQSLQHPRLDHHIESCALNTVLTSAMSDVVRFEDQDALFGAEPEDNNNYTFTGKDGCLHQSTRPQTTESSGLSLAGLSLSDSKRQTPPVSARASASPVLRGDFMRQSLTFTPAASRLATSAILTPMEEIPSSPESMLWSPTPSPDSLREETSPSLHQCDKSMVDSEATGQEYMSNSGTGLSKEFVGDGELLSSHVENTLHTSFRIGLQEAEPSSSAFCHQEPVYLSSQTLHCAVSCPHSTVSPPLAKTDGLECGSTSETNSGGQSPLCELLDSKDGGFEFQSPLTDIEISLPKPILPYMNSSPMSSEADTVLGASPSNLSIGGFSGSISRINTPGSGASVESHHVPLVEEANECSLRGTACSLQSWQISASDVSSDRREQGEDGKNNYSKLYSGLQTHLKQSKQFQSEDEILWMHQKEIDCRGLHDPSEDKLEKKLVAEAQCKRFKWEIAQMQSF
ncbi:unnamed protein product [Sphagnum balticum]